MTPDVLDRARRSRDPRFDGKFFIAVTSTRIYCRSICPAKTSKAANVRFYATAAEAAAAGFRPCLRCRPEAAPGSPAWLGTSAVVRRALRMIQEGALDEGTVEQLASRLGVGVRHLCRLFTRHVGASPGAVAQTRRLHFAKQLLDETRLPITAVALGSGFRSVRRFNDVFKSMYRRPPREIRKVGRPGPDAEIRLRLTYRPPYDWAHLSRFLASEAIRGVESVATGAYQRTVRASDGYAIVRIAPVAGADALELRIRGGEPSDLLSLSSSVRRMFDLSADPSRITEVLQRDPRLRGLVGQRPGLRIPGNWDPFESGVRAIVGFRRAGQAMLRLLGRLIARAGERICDDESGLNYLFPTAQSVLDAELESIGLSAACAARLQSFARAMHEAAKLSAGSGERLMQALAAFPDIGPWAADYVALRGLGEPDAFPHDDRVLLRQASLTAMPLTTQELEVRAELWRPFRGYAVLHLREADTRARR